jgi:hypothetical protein
MTERRESKQKAIILFNKLLDDLVEERGKLLHELSCTEAEKRTYSDARIKNNIRIMNAYCELLEKAIHLEKSFLQDQQYFPYD